MCGIVGYVGKHNRAQEVILEGLRKLEYRGYDSAGMAYLKDNEIVITKEVGKIVNLDKSLEHCDSNLGIGHTRWATHGEVNQINSHPHKSGDLVIVHNGIIENYLELREMLISNGYTFVSKTDTEVAAAYIDYLYKLNDRDIIKTLKAFEDNVKGSYAIAMMIKNDNRLFVVKKNSPLIIGLGSDENYVASDIYALLKYTNKYIVLNHGDMAIIDDSTVSCYDTKGIMYDYNIRSYDNNHDELSKMGYDHYMIKEIYEEGNVIRNNINEYIPDGIESLLERLPDIGRFTDISIVACGSAMHAGMIGKYLLEQYASVPVNVYIASEFRYGKLFINEKSLVISISQSGETADTIAAIKRAHEYGAYNIGIVNRVDSTISREVDMVLYTHAGIEQAVATTKAYLAQVFILSLLAFATGIRKGLIKDTEAVLSDMKKLPVLIDDLLSDNDRSSLKDIASKIYQDNNMFFVGRSIDYYLCMEGSLKLKEISYIHSEAYAAGELKHGTISLIDKSTRVFGVVSDQNIFDKTMSNVEEIRSRGGDIILYVTDNFDVSNYKIDKVIKIPKINELFQSMLMVIPMQVLSYEIALLRGCDIDQPKNLAKSVTVE